MAEHLGHLAWWSVGAVTLTREEAQAIIDECGVWASLPQHIIPVDAFRRLATNVATTYEVDGQVATLALHKASSQKTLLVRDIVRSLHTKEGVAVRHDKVGDAVFYKPPRGRPSKARLRVSVFRDKLSKREWPDVEEFAQVLRMEYDAALGGLDAQAVRRLVRSHLGAGCAIYVGGPYLLPSDEVLLPLEQLFSRLGEGSSIESVPVVNDAKRKQFVGRAIEDAIRAGAGPDLVEAFLPLGVVPDSAWALLEEHPSDRHERADQLA